MKKWYHLKYWAWGIFQIFIWSPLSYIFFQFLKLQSPFKSPKKNSSDYRVHGTQNDQLEPRVSTQKSVFKNMQRVPRYRPKSVQNRPSKPNQQNLAHFDWYLGTRCIFFKTDFCVETVSPSPSIWIPWTL